MKGIITIIFICMGALLYSQDCDYNFKSSIVIWEKDYIPTIKDQDKNLLLVEDYKKCLVKTTDIAELYWLSNSIGLLLNRLNASEDSIVFYAQKAFGYNEKMFCKEFIKVHVWDERGEHFPMIKYYVDNVDSEEMRQIRDHCILNYKDVELQIYDDVDSKQEKELNSISFNQSYFSELEMISKADQKERIKGDDMDWVIQNELDSLNRTQLDSLYSVFGFPDNSKVSTDGLQHAFMVLHHSTNCDWNEKWTKRFLDYHDEIKSSDMFGYYFYRNFDDDGICSHNLRFIEELKKGKHSAIVEKYMDFSVWENK